MKMRIRVQDDPMYPFRDMVSHAALTPVSLKRQVNKIVEYLLTHMDRDTQELVIEVELRRQEEKIS